MLSEEKLWKKVRKLQGKTIYTPDIKKPNKIINVSDNLVEFENRKSHPSKADLFCCYQILTRDKILTEKNTPKYLFDHRIARICYSILANALPEEIKAFHRGEGPTEAQGLSGIKVYQDDGYRGLALIFESMAYALGGIFLLNVIQESPPFFIMFCGWAMIAFSVTSIFESFFNKPWPWSNEIHASLAFLLFFVTAIGFVLEAIRSEYDIYIALAVVFLLVLLLSIFYRTIKLLFKKDIFVKIRTLFTW